MERSSPVSTGAHVRLVHLFRNWVPSLKKSLGTSAISWRVSDMAAREVRVGVEASTSDARVDAGLERSGWSWLYGDCCQEKFWCEGVLKVYRASFMPRIVVCCSSIEVEISCGLFLPVNASRSTPYHNAAFKNSRSVSPCLILFQISYPARVIVVFSTCPEAVS